jgi:hypothetical protein
MIAFEFFSVALSFVPSLFHLCTHGILGLTPFLQAMRNNLSKLAGLASLSLLPETVYAQHIPTWFAVAVLSPLAVILLAIILGILSRSWRTGATHAGLILAWVLLFGLASYFVENDYIIRTPLVLYAAHAVLIFLMIVVNIAKRIGNAGKVEGQSKNE